MITCACTSVHVWWSYAHIHVVQSSVLISHLVNKRLKRGCGAPDTGRRTGMSQLEPMNSYIHRPKLTTNIKALSKGFTRRQPLVIFKQIKSSTLTRLIVMCPVVILFNTSNILKHFNGTHSGWIRSSACRSPGTLRTDAGVLQHRTGVLSPARAPEVCGSSPCSEKSRDWGCWGRG